MSDVTRMMTCQELVELVTDYLDDQLDRGQRARFDEHLEECAPCVIYLHEMRLTIDALGRLPAESLSPDAERELLVAFRHWHESA